MDGMGSKHDPAQDDRNLHAMTQKNLNSGRGAPGTLLTHISTNPEKYDGAVNIPVHRASTIVFNSYEEFEKKPKPFSYGRAGTPSSVAFEQAITALEGAAGSVATCSGLSAIVTALTS